METNELPEEVKRKIEERAHSLYHMGTPEEWSIGPYIEGAEYAYHLGLQSCEKQLKAKDDELAKLKNHLKNCLKQPIAAIGNIDYQKGYKQATSDLLGILPSFLSQSTDKQP